VILVTVFRDPRGIVIRTSWWEDPMREFILVVLVALIMMGGVTAAWFITQPAAATYVR
jgi:hypothetical protein